MASETGKDDKKYIALMNQYKVMRGSDPRAAQKYLEGAMKLRKVGDVSDDAILGGAYL
jgi:uncharacterized protein YfbU (UPF0304 family)